MLKEKVQQLLEDAFDQQTHLYLVALDIDESNNIKITIDGDQGVSVQDCVNISRAVEHNIDREAIDFSLEVGSAGATSPLVLPRQYKKNIGRTLQVKTTDNSKLEGVLDQVLDNAITISWSSREPKEVGKGKVTVQKTQEILFQDIKESKVKIIF